MADSVSICGFSTSCRIYTTARCCRSEFNSQVRMHSRPSSSQVAHNLESQRRQFGLADPARQLGSSGVLAKRRSLMSRGRLLCPFVFSAICTLPFSTPTRLRYTLHTGDSPHCNTAFSSRIGSDGDACWANARPGQNTHSGKASEGLKDPELNIILKDLQKPY
jgi:hypothetical protein